MKLDDIPESKWDELEVDLQNILARGLVIVLMMGLVTGMFLMYIWMR